MSTDAAEDLAPGSAAATDAPLRVALLSYRSKPHCGGQGIYLRHVSRELAALGHHVEVFSGQPYPELEPGPEGLGDGADDSLDVGERHLSPQVNAIGQVLPAE